MKTIKTLTKGNISTTLSQLGENSWRVSQSYLGDTPAQLSMTFYKNIDDANYSFKLLTK